MRSRSCFSSVLNSSFSGAIRSNLSQTRLQDEPDCKERDGGQDQAGKPTREARGNAGSKAKRPTVGRTAPAEVDQAHQDSTDEAAEVGGIIDHLVRDQP